MDGVNWFRCECAPGFAGPDCRISKQSRWIEAVGWGIYLSWGPSSQPQYQELGDINVLILINYAASALSCGFLVPP